MSVIDKDALVVEGQSHLPENVAPPIFVDSNRVNAMVDLSSEPNGSHFRSVKRHHPTREDGAEGVGEP